MNIVYNMLINFQQMRIKTTVKQRFFAIYIGILELTKINSSNGFADT